MSGGEPEKQLLGAAPTLKNCAACGESFSCGAPATGCWCEEVPVAAEVLVALRARYVDCLCAQCLTAAASATAAQSAPQADLKSGARSILP
jgi:hypothetical protein